MRLELDAKMLHKNYWIARLHCSHWNLYFILYFINYLIFIHII